MTDAKQTKCPHCGSTFRISDAQLAAKGGSVRCGSCLQVFRADLHLVGAAPAGTPASTPAKPKARDKADESWAMDLIGEEGKGSTSDNGDDGFGFSDDEVDAFIESKPAATTPQAPKGIRFDDDLSDLMEDAGEGLGGLPGTERTDVINESADESWAKDILSELADEEKQGKNKYSMELIEEKKKGPKNPKMAAALGHASEAGEDVFSRLGQAAPAAPRPAASSRPSDDFLSDDADVLGFLDEDDLGSSPSPATPAPSAASNPFSLDRPLAHVDAPVVLKPRSQPVDWGRLLTWFFLCLIAIGMFAAQYVYFNFDALAVNPATRPLFEKTCAQVGCRLPDIPDQTRLKINELVVRKHPKEAEALQVDAILKNEAPFAQPFPALLLRFTNSQDVVVASRMLRPGEYLAGDAVFLRRMPPETPIRISLSIVDPGKDAVSYSLTPLF